MTFTKRKLELLSPALNAETAIQAILHGADAVYIGPPDHGARKSASNSIEDIERVVDFAHQYRAKVYATVNTVIYDEELARVELLCRELYNAGVDALIVQDMGILRMKLPPIALHASTQCDIRTPEKARFLEEAGFSQLVLARELTLEEIKAITDVVTVPVETFVHGALCVSYSGRCHASYSLHGRSANRGECAQICRYPFTLTDASGNIIEKDKYLLSLKDLNTKQDLKSLIESGVSSFKIEGRLKETGYVKNITALYNEELNKIIKTYPESFHRSSFGQVNLKFTPKADKSFNRGFTNYFIDNRKSLKITSMLTPKSQGEKIRNVKELNNGDGIGFYDNKGNFTGVNINKIVGNKIIPARKIEIPNGSRLYRTSDVKWEKLMKSETATRKIGVSISLDNSGVTARDERGVKIRLPLPDYYEAAKKPMDYRSVFEKLGNTKYYLEDFTSTLSAERFYRISEMNELRRQMLTLLNKANIATYPFEYRKSENIEARYPDIELDYRDNVCNRLSEEFYHQHGVVNIQRGIEVTNDFKKNDIVMTTRHCILRELGMCRKEKRNRSGIKRDLKYPLYLNYQGGSFKLDFNCEACEMQVKLNR